MPKAKAVQPFVEKIITIAKKGTFHARRQIESKINDRKISTPQDVQTAVATHSAGTRVVVVYKRGDKKDFVQVVLAQDPRLAGRNSQLKVERVKPGHWEYVLPDGRRIRVPITPAPPKPPIVELSNDPLPVQEAIEKALKFLEKNRDFEQNRVIVQPPAIRVFRADSDKKIDQLTDEMKALREQVKTLSEQLKSLQKQLRKED
jgi:hypothetical protein